MPDCAIAARASASVASGGDRRRVLEALGVDRRDPQPLQRAVGADEVGAPSATPGRPRISAGVSYCSRTPPTSRMAMRSPIFTASSMSWVTNTTVLLHLALQAEELVLEPHAGHRVDGAERLVHQEHGRDRRRARGPRRRAGAARPTAARGSGRGSRRGRARRGRAARRRARAMRSFDQPSRRGTVPMLVAMVWCGNSPTCWITYPMRRRSSTGSAWVTSSPSRKMRPARRLDQPVDHLQRRRLAAARRPDEHADLAVGDVERSARAPRPAVRVLLADRVETDHRLGRCGGGDRADATRHAVARRTSR